MTDDGPGMHGGPGGQGGHGLLAALRGAPEGVAPFSPSVTRRLVETCAARAVVFAYKTGLVSPGVASRP